MFHSLSTRLRAAMSRDTARFFLLGMVLALLLSPGNLFVDAEKRLQVSRWMWTDEPQVLADDSQFLNHLPGKNGQPMAQFGIGQSLVMLPADMLCGAILGTKMTPQQMKLREMIVYYLTFPLITGLALAMARRVCGWFITDARRADLATIAFAFCSSFLIYGRDTQENMLMQLCVLGGVWHGLHWSRDGRLGHAAAMAAFLGFLILIRISTVSIIVPFCAAFGLIATAGHWKQRRASLFAGVAVISVILLFFVALDRVYHWHRFGEFTRTYAWYMIEQAKRYGYGNNYPMGYPFWSGMFGFFLDTRKSAFLFDPLLVVSVVMLFIPSYENRSLRGLLAASLAAVFLTACLYARSDFWHGDTSWGPRHLNIAILPAVLFGVIAFMSLPRQSSRPWLRPVFSMLAAAGFTIQALSLPLYQELEIEQWKASYPITCPPVLRVLNLVSVAKHDPTLWNLDCDNDRVPVIQKLPLQFAPFQIAHAMPGSVVGKLLIAAWCFALAVFAAIMVAWIRGLRSLA